MALKKFKTEDQEHKSWLKNYSKVVEKRSMVQYANDLLNLVAEVQTSKPK